MATRQQASQLAVAEERNRLAREMHDSLGHRLTVAIVQLEGAKRLIPSEPDRAAGMIGDMRGQLKDGLGELRQTLSTLRTDPGDGQAEDVPLPTSLRRLTETFSQATGLPVSLSLAEQLPDLSPLQRNALFRAAQEGLTNVERHADATEAWVALSAENETVTLTIADNGRGLPEIIPEGRFGLQGLRERAEQVGGEFMIAQRQPKGTLLTFVI